ncbi:hypothetical protein G7D34_003716, partial [Salmonella enterica]|nr:hypothetical protein [Salmonella enterica]
MDLKALKEVLEANTPEALALLTPVERAERKEKLNRIYNYLKVNFAKIFSPIWY